MIESAEKPQLQNHHSRSAFPELMKASILLLCLTLSPSAWSAQRAQEVPGEPTASIAWYGTWEQGLAEAKRLELPILLHSGAPRCGGVPGMW